ncbi:MAG: ATPase domain-containing protein [Candidatus Thalassarchaeaceae archaeon]|nr:ATPase domain-containing protein [Candidatus Thalassarchaeaceae archaeon]
MSTTIQFDSEDEDFYGDMGSIGSAKFDSILAGSPLNKGSIPRGFTMLAIGNQGAGMDLFAKQFTSVAEDPENTLLVSTGESQTEILSLFKRYNWPTDIMVRTLGEEYNKDVLERELSASRYRLEGFTMEDIQRLAQTRFVENEVHDYLTDLASQVTSLPPFFRASVDNLDFFFARNDPSRVISMIRMMQAHTQLHRGLMVLNVSSDMVDKSVERELYAICDIVLEFEVGMLGTDFETRMVIRKFRNGPENLRAISFRVTKEEAITPETVDRIA